MDSSRQTLVTLDSTSAETIIFNTADFPGWNAYVNGERVPHSVTEDGRISVTVPAAASQVGILFQRTPIRTVADIVTILTCIGVALVWRISATQRVESRRDLDTTETTA